MKNMHMKKNEISMLDVEQKEVSKMFTSQQEMDDFEDAVRTVLKEQKDRLNLTDEAVGKIAFSFMAGKRTKVQAIFVGQGAGQYRNKQKLRLPDMMNLAEALGMTLPDVIKAALKRMP